MMTDVDSEPDPAGSSSRSARRRRREDERWTVVASEQLQGEEGLRWIQLDWARDSLRSWWPKKAPPE